MDERGHHVLGRIHVDEQPERLAMAAYMVGRDDDGDDAGARAFQECLRLGELPRAARCAFWLGFGLLYRGEVARGSGWRRQRGRRIENRPKH